MVDFILKLLPIFAAIGPLLVWLDKSTRFAHKRKLYAKRIEEIKAYTNKYYQKEVPEIEKDCAAQLLVGSEKVGHHEVDYVIENCPQRFFSTIEDVITARKFIEVKIEDEKPVLVTKYTKKQLIKINAIFAVIYFLTLGILYINDILVMILKWLPVVNPIEVSATTYFLGFIFSLALFLMCISIAWLYFWSADSTLRIYDKLKLKHIPEE